MMLVSYQDRSHVSVDEVFGVCVEPNDDALMAPTGSISIFSTSHMAKSDTRRHGHKLVLSAVYQGGYLFIWLLAGSYYSRDSLLKSSLDRPGQFLHIAGSQNI